MKTFKGKKNTEKNTITPVNLPSTPTEKMPTIAKKPPLFSSQRRLTSSLLHLHHICMLLQQDTVLLCMCSLCKMASYHVQSFPQFAIFFTQFDAWDVRLC